MPKKKSESDPTRYTLSMVEEAIEGKYTPRQLTQVLSECGYEQFPSNGINDEGFRKFMNRIAEIDSKEANLVRVERKDLSSRTDIDLCFDKPKKASKQNGIIKRIGNSIANTTGRMLDFCYDHSSGIKRTAAAVLIPGALFGVTFGRRNAYNVKYINAVNTIELTQEENAMRSEFFDYFYKPEMLPRTTALTNNYFLVAKETGLTTKEAMKIIGQSINGSNRANIREVSKYIKSLRRNGISIEEGIYFLKKAGYTSEAIKLINKIREERIILK